MFKLHVIVASTRPGRVGTPVARWFVDKVARPHSEFDVRLVELSDVALPLLDEPEHPRFERYQHDHTKAWSRTVDEADAFVFVTPEYNYSVAAPLVNALDYLSREWAYKPVGFVSYGGVSGGTRGVQMAKQIVTALRMMPTPESVTIPFVYKLMNDGVFDGGEVQAKAGKAMLDEVARWTGALASLREASRRPSP